MFSYFQFILLDNFIYVIASFFRPLARGSFFNVDTSRTANITARRFRPLARGSFFNMVKLTLSEARKHAIFVPLLGDLFSMVCLESSILSVLVSGFAAGMGKFYHKIIFFEGKTLILQPWRASAGIIINKQYLFE